MPIDETNSHLCVMLSSSNRVRVGAFAPKGFIMSVSWGRRQRFRFEPAGALTDWSPGMIPAVYAITYKQDPKNKPKAHTVLYFGQCDDLSQQAHVYNRDVLDIWKGNGGDVHELCVFVHPLPGSSRHTRVVIHEQLVSEYSPDCNRY